MYLCVMVQNPDTYLVCIVARMGIISHYMQLYVVPLHAAVRCSIACSLVPSRKRVRKIRLVTFSNILGLHLLFIVYQTCTCVIPRCCLITRSNDLQLHHYFSVINCAVMTSHCCLICGKKALPLSRRIIDPPSPGIHGVRDFFVRFVKPGFVFPALASGNRCQYWKSLC